MNEFGQIQCIWQRNFLVQRVGIKALVVVVGNGV